MDYRQDYQNDEAVIDLKELLFYILRKWRVLILAGILGVVLGSAVMLLMPEKTIDDLKMDELHLEEIGQYARYQQLYDEQLENEAMSVYMNMDPNCVHSAQKIYYITAYEADMNRINEGIAAITRSTNLYTELAEVSGLGCTEKEIRELASLWFSRYEKSEIDPLFGDLVRSGKLTISIMAPNDEACDGMMDYLDARVQEVCDAFVQTMDGFAYEVISDTCNVGYNAGVINARRESAELLTSYVEMMTTLEKTLTDDDKLYYSEVYAVEEEEEETGLGWLKWGIVVGVLLGGMMVAFYGVMYLLDGSVKNVEEIKRYGLHLIALLEGAKKAKKSCIIDQLLEGKLEYNSDAYLRTAIDVSNAARIQLCGDLENAAIAKKMNLFADDAKTVICSRLAVDERAQRIAGETDGVVLFAQLWKTRHSDLARELEICRHIDQKVIGVVLID